MSIRKKSESGEYVLFFSSIIFLSSLITKLLSNASYSDTILLYLFDNFKFFFLSKYSDPKNRIIAITIKEINNIRIL